MWVCVHIGMPALILHAEVFVEWFICDFVSGLVNMQAMMDLLVFKEFGDRANLALARRAWAPSHSLCLSRQWGGIKYIALAIVTEGWKWESVLACSSHCIALLYTERAAINCHTNAINAHTKCGFNKYVSFMSQKTKCSLPFCSCTGGFKNGEK